MTLKDGRVVKARPVWALLRERLAEFTPEIVSEICEVPADDIREAATIWATPVDPDRASATAASITSLLSSMLATACRRPASWTRSSA